MPASTGISPRRRSVPRSGGSGSRTTSSSRSSGTPGTRSYRATGPTLRNPGSRSTSGIPEWLTGRPLSFDEWFELRVLQARFLTFGHYRFPRHYDCYMENDRPLVDFIGRYENLTEHLAVISDRIRIPIVLSKTRGTNRHKERVPYTERFDERKKRIVADWYRQGPRLPRLSLRRAAADGLHRAETPALRGRRAAPVGCGAPRAWHKGRSGAGFIAHSLFDDAPRPLGE